MCLPFVSQLCPASGNLDRVLRLPGISQSFITFIYMYVCMNECFMLANACRDLKMYIAWNSSKRGVWFEWHWCWAGALVFTLLGTEPSPASILAFNGSLDLNFSLFFCMAEHDHLCILTARTSSSHCKITVFIHWFPWVLISCLCHWFSKIWQIVISKPPIIVVLSFPCCYFHSHVWDNSWLPVSSTSAFSHAFY